MCEGSNLWIKLKLNKHFEEISEVFCEIEGKIFENLNTEM